MSRKAMKKTLQRLQKTAFYAMEEYRKVRVETYRKPVTRLVLNDILITGDQAVNSLLTYAKALEDAYSEFAEPFDKKLETMEKAVQTVDKPAESKEKANKRKKTSYIG